MKRKRRVSKPKTKKFLGLSVTSWVIIGVLALMTLLPDFPLDIITGLGDVAYLMYAVLTK